MTNDSYSMDNDIPFSKIFGARIRARRMELNLSQSDLYEKTGISLSYISAVERGIANPSLDIIIQLCNALDTKIGEMLN